MSFEKLPIELQREVLRITISDTFGDFNVKKYGMRLVVNYMLVNSIWFDIVIGCVYKKLDKSIALVHKAGLVRFDKICSKCISKIDLTFFWVKELDVERIAQNVHFENVQRLIFENNSRCGNKVVNLMSPNLLYIKSIHGYENGLRLRCGDAVLKELLEKRSHYYPKLKLDLAFDLPMLRLLKKEVAHPPYYYPTVELRETVGNVITENDLDIVGRLPGVEELRLMFKFDSDKFGNPIRCLLQVLKRLHIETWLMSANNPRDIIVNDESISTLADLLSQLPSTEKLGIHIGESFNTFANTMIQRNTINWKSLKKFAVTIDLFEPEVEKTAGSLIGLLKFGSNIESLDLTVLSDLADCKDLIFLPDLPNLKEFRIDTAEPLLNMERQLLKVAKTSEQGRKINMYLYTLINVGKLLDHMNEQGYQDDDLIFGNVGYLFGVCWSSEGERHLCVHEFVYSRLDMALEDLECMEITQCRACEGW